ncbi:hypothetical protein SAMN02745163_02976 [Clostridium cavendishii DSM 21758]|uniref:HEAT repeat-containing protein n=1 Tax=Clostridium cavendishii DSM 21758 TaxID=1121302 RepID=A0A1M6NQ75_9CLOT|nr:HEAT repeat domain-containing protein [Clostridium cavendishii]SHJ97810.1 hypothetical protein SAMN02745163_02976 [Clostridium cavendishii DSM 21758]
MEVLINEFREELDSFWKWEGLSSDEYERGEKYFKYEEFYYPNWNGLMQFADRAIEIIKTVEKSHALANLLLEVIAIDNENEITMEKCEQLLEIDAIRLLSEVAIKFPMYEARWQIAELIGRSDNDNCRRYLLDFVRDEHKYVQRRALISLSRIYPQKAEDISIEKLTDSDDYLRLVSIRILKELDSKYLPTAAKLLKNDTFKYVKEELELIKEDILNLGDAKGNFI